jgi:hypothetical protein
MGEIAGICICGIVFLSVYKTFVLFVRKKERLIIIEKLTVLSENEEFSKSLHLPDVSFSKTDYGSWSLRISLLLIGVGLGCLLSFFTQYYLFDSFSDYNVNDWRIQNRVSDIKVIVNFSYIAIFGGIGLLIAYLIESKKTKKDSEKK